MESPAKSEIQICYKIAESGMEYEKATKEAKLKFKLLMDVRPFVQANINKASTSVMWCSGACRWNETTSYCRFERFHESQRGLVSNAYNTPKHDVNVPDVPWKLISK